MEIPFDKIKPFSAVIILFIVGGIIAPGFLFLYIYERDTFLSLEYFPLILLVLSFSLPMIVLNTFIFAIIQSIVHEGDHIQNVDQLNHHYAGCTMIAGFVGCCALILAIILGYFFHYKTSTGVLISMSVDLGILIFLWICLSRNKKMEEEIEQLDEQLREIQQGGG